jgi:hypothetical protein
VYSWSAYKQDLMAAAALVVHDTILGYVPMMRSKCNAIKLMQYSGEKYRRFDMNAWCS